MKFRAWTLGALTLVALTLITIPETADARRRKSPIVTKISADFKKINRKDPTQVMVTFHKLTNYVKRLYNADAVTGFRQLKKDLYARSLQYTPQIIQLHAAMLSSAKLSHSRSTMKLLVKMHNQIKPIVKVMTNKWGSAVSLKVSIIFAPALKLANRYPADLKTIISPLLVKAYNNSLTYAGSCLAFLGKVDNLELKSIGYLILGKLMSYNGHFDSPQAFQLAYAVNDVMTGKKTRSRLSSNTKRNLDKTKKLLPRIVREIVFNGKKCRVKNQHFGTYIYADPEVKDKEHRYEYLWRRSWESKSADRWSFATTPKDKGTAWTIENEHYKDYLMANESSAHVNLRSTYLWRDEKNVPAHAQWAFSMVDGGKRLVMRNTMWSNEYLFADDKHQRDQSRRNLFTWEGSGSAAKKARLEAKAKECQERRPRNEQYQGPECEPEKKKEVEKPQGKMWLESKWDVRCGY